MKKVLIVDDEESIRRTLGIAMKLYGSIDPKNIFLAEDGLSALKHIEKEGHPDVIITDIRMPKMDGDVLLERLKLNSPERYKPMLKLIITADAYRTEESEVRIKNLEAKVITKPYDIFEITDLVSKYKYSGQ